MDASDEALCQRVAEQDEAAFDLLVARYQARAYRLAWSLVRDAEDARDVSQEAFVRLYQSAASFRGGARFSTWFYRIVVNQCLDLRRRRRWWRRWIARGERGEVGEGEQGSLVERQPSDTAPPGVRVEDAEMSARLWRAVQALSPKQRAAIVLQVQEELPTSEIAAVLECSEPTVRVHLHRAVSALRKTLTQEDG